MKFFSCLLVAVCFSLNLHAQPPRSEAEYCELAKDLRGFKKLTEDPDNLMAFGNMGGLLDGGVCWWHSRFQRNALYLTIYKPELKKPTKKEAKRLIDAIVHTSRVTVIPGFKNFQEFTATYAQEIQSALNAWQIRDGFIKQAWIDGLWGSTHQESDKLKRNIDKLYVEVEKKYRIVYVKLQIPGIDAHAWLIVDMVKTATGYEITYIDSNAPNQTLTYNYKYGDITFDGGFYYGDMIPYTRHFEELRKIQVEMLRFCNPKLAMSKWIEGLQLRYQQLNASSGFRGMIELAFEAASQGHFTETLKELTFMDDKELEPANWFTLMTSN
jgi:hypothetical protein